MRRALFPILAFVALAVIGCGGGGQGVLNPGLITPTGTPIPHPGPTSLSPTSSPQEVIISGAGYTLKFTLPAITVGSAASVSAALQATPPPGIPLLQSHSRAPKVIGGSAAGLVYLTLSTTAGVGFASLPSFVWTLPSASVIPAGSSAFMSFYDPSAGGWQATHLASSASAGTTLSFPGASGGFSLAANAQYVYALTVNTTVPPTPTPAPVPTGTPSPAPTPTAAPLAVSCPTPPANTFPLNIVNNTGITSPLKIYVWGQALPGSANTGNWVSLNDPSSGNVTVIPSAGGAMPSFTPPPNNCINLPPLVSARVYFYFQTQNTGTTDVHSNGPSIASGGVADPLATNSTYGDDIANVWDFAEYTWYGGTQKMTFDLTAVDGVGIPATFNLVNGTSPISQTFGLPSGMLSQSINSLKSLGRPWSDLIGSTKTLSSNGTLWSRIVAPQDALGASAGTVSFDPNYMILPPSPSALSVIDQVWNQYKTPHSLQISYGGYTGVGQVDAGNNFNFYTTLGGSLITTIGKPTSSADVFGNSGVFVPTPAPGVTQLYANEMGRALSVGILRGTLPVPGTLPSGWPSSTVQPFCGASDWTVFYNGYLNAGASVPSATVMDWYAAVVHKNAINGLLYGFPDDDSCNNAVTGNAAYAAVYNSSYSPGYQWSVTLNPF